MLKNQHNSCREVEVKLKVGEEFEWITAAEYCDIHILDDHPLDQDDYHVVRGTATPAKAIGGIGRYEFECKCSDHGSTPRINPHIIIS